MYWTVYIVYTAFTLYFVLVDAPKKKLTLKKSLRLLAIQIVLGQLISFMYCRNMIMIHSSIKCNCWVFFLLWVSVQLQGAMSLFFLQFQAQKIYYVHCTCNSMNFSKLFMSILEFDSRRRVCLLRLFLLHV